MNLNDYSYVWAKIAKSENLAQKLAWYLKQPLPKELEHPKQPKHIKHLNKSRKYSKSNKESTSRNRSSSKTRQALHLHVNPW